MQNIQVKTHSVDVKPEPKLKVSNEYWEILSSIAGGKEKVYSHEYVMLELHKILKK